MTTNCPSEDILLDYSAGRLDRARMLQFDAHATTCASCAKFRAAQMSVWETLDEWKPAPVSEGFNRELWRRIDADVQSWWLTAGLGQGLWLRLKEASNLAFWKQVAPLAVGGVLIVTGFMLDHSIRKAENPMGGVVVTASDADQIERALDDLQLLHDVDTASSAVRVEPGVM